jgi:excinuclease UvrABC helicase subunit UvrB
MKKEELVLKTKDEIMEFIRQRLTITKKEINHFKNLNEGGDEISDNRLRFQMSGYETKTGQCTVWNMEVLNRFAEFGIYDYTKYLVIDFYKGTPIIYLQYFNEDNSIIIDELGGLGTRELIYKIFELTILSDKPKRRRI